MKKNILLSLCIPTIIVGGALPLASCKSKEEKADAFKITNTITNGKIKIDSTISAGEEKQFQITPDSGYTFPDTITVNGAEHTYDKTNGKGKISNPTRDVVIKADCVVVTTIYDIDHDIKSGDITIDSTISVGEEKEFKIEPNTGYHLPSSITVTGAQHTYNPNDGTGKISNPTSDVEIKADCIANSYTITTSVLNGTITIDSTISFDEVKNFRFTPYPGFELPATITVTGAQHTYKSIDGTGTLFSPTSDVNVSIYGKQVTYDIHTEAENCTITGPIKIVSGGDASLQINASTGYIFPKEDDIMVEGASISEYDQDNGILIITQPTSDVRITIACNPRAFIVSSSIEHTMIQGSDVEIHTDEEKKFNLLVDFGYDLNLESLNITNASLVKKEEIDTNKFEITIKNPVNAVMITADNPTVHEIAIYQNVEHCQLTWEGKFTIDQPLEIQINPDSGYVVPGKSQISVTGAKFDLDEYTNKLTLTEPTNNVVGINIVCKPISELFTWERDGNNAKITKYLGTSKKTVLSIPDTVTLDDGQYTINGIAASAFKNNTDIKDITLPTGVTAIEDETFYGCSKLEEFSSRGTITSIGDTAFYGCSKLVDLPFENGTTTIGDFSFRDCSSLKFTALPSTITSIGNHAFWNCDAITKITFPNISSGEYAFRHCTHISEITFAPGLTTPPTGVFYDCPELTTVDLSNTSIKTLSLSLFAFCKNLQTFKLPPNLTWIRGSTFENCESLNDISYPGTCQQFANVTKDEGWADDIPATVVHCSDGDWPIPESAR